MDLLDYAPASVRRGYPACYKRLVTVVPWLWAALYRLLDQRWFVPIYQPLRRRWNRLITGRFVRWVEQLKPDWMIATHFSPGDVLAAAGGGQWMRARGIVVITDLFPHRLWLTSAPRAFVVGTERSKALCVADGIDPQRIAVLGIPVSQAFGAPRDRSALRAQLGLDPQRPTVLISSGGMGHGPIAETVERLLVADAANPRRLQLLVVCGENAELCAKLQRYAEQTATPMRVFGFVRNMPELMAASDMMITKAGGLTVTEALASGLPMIFSGSIPSQEQFNAKYVVEQGAAVMSQTPEDAARAVALLLEDPKRLEQLRERARGLARPRAAEELVQRLMENRI